MQKGLAKNGGICKTDSEKMKEYAKRTQKKQGNSQTGWWK